MTFDEKLAAGLALLESTGIWRSNYAPPLLRLFWKLGVKIPPPHFVGFAANFVFTGTLFGITWGLLMWSVFWSHQRVQLGIAFGAALFAGLMFGLCIAGYYCYGAHKHRIPLWRDFRPTHENSRT